jgi:hypothetical protein
MQLAHRYSEAASVIARSLREVIAEEVEEAGGVEALLKRISGGAVQVESRQDCDRAGNRRREGCHSLKVLVSTLENL